MRFSWDEAKEASNRAKHGASLSLAREIDPASMAAVEDRRRPYGERRFIVYAKINGRVHVVILSPRDDEMRVISLRKANRRETEHYENSRSASGRSERV